MFPSIYPAYFRQLPLGNSFAIGWRWGEGRSGWGQQYILANHFTLGPLTGSERRISAEGRRESEGGGVRK